MPAPSTSDEFLELVRKSGVADEKRLGAYLERLRATSALPPEPSKLAGLLVHDAALLTNFQAEQLLLGKWRRFTIGKYKVLERLGQGGMGSVYLCEHKLMRRRVAVKVLPTAKADDPSSLERFYREARAVAALDHPNIVRAYDIDQDDKLHFLVMEYVDGSSLQEIIKKTGPMDVTRACHYIRQAALGLQHAFESAGLIHRDIKPGNILIDRSGVVKILDMGLARFFHDEEDVLTKKYDENVLGTADYLAPEQALDSHGVDIRADIYGLGATFYFCLTGRTPFTEGTVAQKLIWHQTRQPKPIRQLRPEVPEALVAIIDKMMAKDPDQRYQRPLEVAEALTPWTETPIGPPPEEEMPQLSPAALGLTVAAETTTAVPMAAPTFSSPPSSARKKNWQVASPEGARPPSGSSAPPLPPAKAMPPGAAVTPRPAVAPGPRSAPMPAPPPPPSSGHGPTSPRPTPASAPVMPAAEEEEQAPWEQLATDTADMVAHADTPPRSRRTASARGLPGSTAIGLPDRRRVWWVVGIVTGVVLLVVAGLVIWAATRNGGPPDVTPDKQPPSRTLRVGGDAPFKTVHAALAQVKANDRIVVQGPIAEELIADGRGENRKNITIEADDAAGPVAWLAPKNRSGGCLVMLSNFEGLRLRGFTFDGEGRFKAGLMIRGRCPGTAVEDVRVQGFTEHGVRVLNCEGDEGRPVTLSRVLVRPPAGVSPAAALTFEFDTAFVGAKANQHIRLSDCRLEGTYQTGPIKVFNHDKLGPIELEGVTASAGPDQPGTPITSLPK